MSTRNFTYVCLLISSIGILAIVAISNGWFATAPFGDVAKPRVNSVNEAEVIKAVERTVPEGHVKVGDVFRPLADVELVSNTGTQQATRGVHADPGSSPSVPRHANAHTRSVAEAFDDPELAHRLTAMLPAPDFELEMYNADRQAYVTTVEPGRVWQNLQPAEGVTKIRRASDYYHKILQGESVVLKARVDPGMPVTWYSGRLGQFENLLSSITVEAGSDGIATTTFKATPGTRGEIDILASSPVHSDHARYLVTVLLPQSDEGNPSP